MGRNSNRSRHVTIEGSIDVNSVDGELIVGTGSAFEVTSRTETLGCAGGTVD